MKREDINYLNSWSKCFKKASIAQVIQGLIDGIWICSNYDPEDIYLVQPKLIVRSTCPDVDKEFGLCPFEFSIRDGETYKKNIGSSAKAGEEIKKGRMINDFGYSWCLDKYEMRKAVTKIGLEHAKENKISKEEVEALHKKFGWDDEAAYKELMANRPDLMKKSSYDSNYIYPAIDEDDYKYIRAAFIPHCDTLYNWMDYPQKAGIDYPDIDHRK